MIWVTNLNFKKKERKKKSSCNLVPNLEPNLVPNSKFLSIKKCSWHLNENIQCKLNIVV